MSASSSSGQQLGDAGDVGPQPVARTLGRDRWADDAAVARALEVDRRRHERRAGAEREGRRTRGQRRPLAEELDLDAVALEVAVADEADELVARPARLYVDRAPHFTADAGLTVSSWRGWSGSLRMRAINHYRLDGEDASIVASGHTVLDLSVVRRIRRGVEFNFAIDNLTNRSYYETQNYLESRPYPDGPASFGIHATPGYPRTLTVGLTFRFAGK